MAWLVPYVINGAAHSAALFRRQAQRPATDQVGVSRPGDLKVTQLPAAATGFRIAQGGLSLPSRFPGRGRESYGVENGDAVIDVTDVPGTGSSARRDAVVVELLDPNYLPITHAEAELTNYMTVHVVQGVAAGAKTIDNIPSFNNRTAYVLAFINWPANTTAITNAMIEDARRTANPILGRVLRAINLSEKGSGYRTPINATSAYPAGGETWPQEAVEAGILDIEIPADATHMLYAITWSQLSTFGGFGRAWGGMWLQIGRTDDPDNWKGQLSQWDTVENASSTMMMRVAETRVIPAELRGKTKRFYPRVNRTEGVADGSPRLTWASSFEVDVTFESRAV